MDPLWKLRSGKFAGWNYDGQVYDAKGKHVGYFQGQIAVGCNGRVVGEMYDDKFLATVPMFRIRYMVLLVVMQELVLLLMLATLDTP